MLNSVAPNAAFNENRVSDATSILDAFPDLGNAFPTYTPEDQQRDRAALSESASFPPAQRAFENTADSIEIKTDPNNKRIHELPQSAFHASDLEQYKNEMKNNADYSQVASYDFGDSNEAREFKRSIIKAQQDENEAVDSYMGRITQDGPVVNNYDESYIETAQGPFSELPYASNLTKYFLRQFRPDPRVDTNITITLSVNVAQTGTSHFSCPQPAASTRSGSTFSFLGGVQGPGCQNWSASGSMNMLNDFTQSAQTLAKATAAYGNPYQVT